jgi:branched-chain amino acid transport system substrate-binding protein
MNALACLGAAAALTPAGSRASPTPLRIGHSLPLSGRFGDAARLTHERPVTLWAEQVNAAGGLSVRGTRRRVEIVPYDDGGDIALTTQHYLKLITVDKVDFILAPWGTAATAAVAPLASRYDYPLIAPTCQSRKLIDMNMRGFFCLQQQADKIMAAVVDVLLDRQIRNIGVLYMDDVFGLETLSGLQLAMHGKGIEVRERQAHALGATDLSGSLTAIKKSGAEAFVGITYPGETFLAAKQSKQVGFNPKLFFTAVGTAFPAYRQTFGAGAEGVLGMGAWNAKTSPAAKAFFDAHVKRFNAEPDRNATGFSYAALQILQNAVEHAGVERHAVVEYIAGHQFDTLIGPMRFVNGEDVALPGTLGQWQGSEFEIVWPHNRATAPLAFPKGPWA